MCARPNASWSRCQQLPVRVENALFARWSILKAGDGGKLTDKQAAALAEPEVGDFLTAKAWRIKEKLRWVRQATTPNAARWRLSSFLRHARGQIICAPLLEAVGKALDTVEKHRERILQRWTSTYSNVRMEALNGLFKVCSKDG